MTTATPVVALAAATARWVLDPVLSAVFPAACPVCHSLLDRPLTGPLCASCWSALPHHRTALCRCGAPRPASGSEACGRCRRTLSLFESGASLGPYEGGLRVLVHELKYRGRRRVAERLADRLAAEPTTRRLLSPDAVLVPVPLHPGRQRERGFNQAELLARALARRCGLPHETRVLHRRRPTAPQTGLTAAARRRNLAGAFRVRRPALVRGRTVVLVDDVVTTGATSMACAGVLRQAGAREVRLLTVARVV